MENAGSDDTGSPLDLFEVTVCANGPRVRAVPHASECARLRAAQKEGPSAQPVRRRIAFRRGHTYDELMPSLTVAVAELSALAM